MIPRRRLLFIAVGFPPHNSSGTPRSTKFVKYLGDFGWEPVVVTLDWEKVLDPSQLDYSRMDELPQNLIVYRIKPFNPVLALGEFIRGKRQDHASRITHHASITTYSEISGKGASRSWGYKAARSLYHFGLAPVGDEHFYWSLRALPECIRIARWHNVEAILVSVSPWTSALLGLMLKKILHLPLVVDFRDYWTLWPVKEKRVVRDKLDSYLERCILKAADRILCVHEPMAEDFARIEPRAAAKCMVVTNGYDPADFGIRDSGLGVRGKEENELGPESRAPSSEPRIPNPESRTILTHIGMVWGDAAVSFLKTLSRLKDKAIERKLRVNFVGGLPPSNLQFIREHGLDSFVTVEPRTTHREAIARMLQADALILLITSSEGGQKWYPGKLFEYMAAGRPVLAVAPSGIASHLIEQAGIGASVDHTDREKLEQMITLAAEEPEEFRRRHYHPQASIIEKYNRVSLTRRLAKVLDELIERG